MSVYSTLDAQINVTLLDKIQVKLGATNITNKYYYSFIGGPAIGGYYYLNVVYSL